MGPPAGPVARKRKVVVFYTDAGGGHRAAALALREVLEATGAWTVVLVNPYEQLVKDSDWFGRFTSRSGEDVYNEVIIAQRRTGLTCLAYYAIATLNTRMSAAVGVRAFADHIAAEAPDLVVSVMPLINTALSDACLSVGVPLSILLTDWDEITRNVWFPRGKRHTFTAICGTERSVATLLRRGFPEARVRRMDGLLIWPEFQPPTPQHKREARRTLGLDDNKPAVCLFFGSSGGGRVAELADVLLEAPHPPSILALCGRDSASAAHLRKREGAGAMVVVEYTSKVPLYLTAADVVVGKPGPGSVSEALAMGLPVLLDGRTVLPQERAVLRSIRDAGWGTTFRRESAFLPAVKTLLQSDNGVTPPQNRSAAQIERIISDLIPQRGSQSNGTV